MRNLFSFAAACVVLLATALPVSADAKAVTSALNMATEDAELVVLIPSMTQLDAKLKAFNDQLQLNMGDLAAALRNFKETAGIHKGMDDRGSMIIIVQNLAEAISGEEADAIMMLPVTDYNAFIENFGAEKPGEAAIDEITLPGGRAGFAKFVGQYAVLGANEQSIKGYEPATAGDAWITKVAALTEDQLGGADAIIFAQLEKIGPSVAPMLDMISAMAGAAGPPAGGGDPMAAAMNQAMVTRLTSTLSTALKDAAAAAIVLEIDATGLGLTTAMQFKTSSTSAKNFTGGDEPEELLALMPDQPWTIAMSANMEAIAVAGMLEAFVDDLPKEAKWMQDMITATTPVTEQIKSVAQVSFMPDPNSRAETDPAVSIYTVKDPKKFTAAMAKALKDMDKISMKVPASQAGGEDMEIEFNASYRTNALEIDGVKVDEYRFETVLPALMQAQILAEGRQPPPPVNGYLGVTEDDMIVMTTTRDIAVIKAAFDAVKAKRGLTTDPAFAQYAGSTALPNAAMQMYLNLGAMLDSPTLGQGFAHLPLKIDPKWPPVALSMAARDGSVAWKTYVPNAVTAAFMQMQKDMAAGVQPRGRGGRDRPR